MVELHAFFRLLLDTAAVVRPATSAPAAPVKVVEISFLFFGVMFCRRVHVVRLKAATMADLLAYSRTSWCCTVARPPVRGNLPTTFVVRTDASSLDNSLCNEAILIETARLGDSQRLKQITRAVSATTVVGAAPATRATAVQVSEHALRVHFFSGVVAVHVDAFDALLADASAD